MEEAVKWVSYHRSPLSGMEKMMWKCLRRADNRFKSLITMKLYVGNLSFDMTERTLRELFEPFGTVSEVKLIMDRETGQSRGFGFVTMGNISEGNAAIKGLHGKDKGGRKLTVNEARPWAPSRSRVGKGFQLPYALAW